ncbi:hypothetical protein AK812_SmicGene18103 [Symbiodinium microadriaticum]|uniref:Reverse transcriptase domain-containing protein n=1 Tax=Symbiodinium microadriaticum TaxID=2951 RepID=A0A1Q9DW15_SYMMI|nr:hypothetical protein AK812_SmicGene18103 [Symbiodinium microadriaticum]
MFGGVHSRLAVLEAANAAPPSDPKVAELSKQVERLTKLVENRQFESAPPSPPSASPTSRPYAQIPPPQFDPWSNFIGKASNTTEGVPRLNKAPAAPRLPSSADDDTDYNHVVVGGWEEDTVKRQIQQDLGKLLATFTIEYKRAISKDIIYGPRACTAHLYLHPLEPVQARDRFYALQAAYNKTVRTASGNEMWLSPSRSPERRFQNRITGVAGKLILALWPEGIQTPVLEYNYRQQIVWAEGVRVAAASQDHLRAKSSHKLGTTELSDASGQGASYHFNISALSRLTGLDDASEDAFHQAVHELQVLCQGHRREEVVLIGDFNVEPSTDRAALLDDALSHCKFQQFRPEGATRFGHRSASALDFAYISEPISRRLLPNESHIKVVQGSRREVGSDHDKICLELVFGQRLPHSSKRHKDRRRRARGKCGRWTVKPNIGASVQSCEGFRDLDVHGQWEHLKQLQRACSFPTPSCKYRDSIALKDMCRQRREEVDPCAKQTLTRAIVAKRSAEKAEWLRSLESRAASGDARAIHYLKGRLQPRHAWGVLIRNCGVRSAAVEAVRTHFRDILSPVVPAAEQAECAHLLHKLTAATESLTPTPFTYDEISKAVQHLKPGKTSGMTGISAELVKALWQDGDGQSIISCFCNSLLSTDDPPSDLDGGFVALLPKVAHVQTASQIRPIHLVEVCQKLFSYLLIQRLQGVWHKPAQQHGALQGGQTLDALATAQWIVASESFREQSGRVWLNTDITSAFDSLKHTALIHFVLKHTPHDRLLEAHRLVRMVLCPTLNFDFLNQQWSSGQTSGVQQGHSHSAVLFSFVIGHILQDVFRAWSDCGYSSTLGDWGWLFVDDLILSFDSWGQARALVPMLQHAFCAAGLSFSVKKSQILGMPPTLEQGRQEQWEHDEFLYQIPWVECTRYLKKPLCHFGVTESLTTNLMPGLRQRAFQAYHQLKSVVKGMRWESPRLTVALLNRYVGSTFFWYTPLFFPGITLLKEITVMQVTMLCSLMHLFIPANAPTEVAMTLQQLRRRCVLLVLGFLPHAAWSFVWRLRTWNYLGHVLRRDAASSVHRALLLLNSARRPRGGVITSPLSWLKTAVSAQYPEIPDVSFDSLVAVAAQRDVWASRGRAYVGNLSQAERHSMLHVSDSTWKNFITPWVVWNLSVIMLWSQDGWVFTWLDECEGFQQWSLGLQVHSTSVMACILHMRMEHDFFSIQDTESLDVILQSRSDPLPQAWEDTEGDDRPMPAPANSGVLLPEGRDDQFADEDDDDDDDEEDRHVMETSLDEEDHANRRRVAIESHFIMVVDTSGSMSTITRIQAVFNEVKQLASTALWLQENARTGVSDKMSLITFSDAAEIKFQVAQKHLAKMGIEDSPDILSWSGIERSE